ncbi:MAG: hypothetical protein ABSC05_29920 [Candidatus Solibacter sp.]
MVSWDGNLYAVDARTGQERWRFPYAEGSGTTPTSSTRKCPAAAWCGVFQQNSRSGTAKHGIETFQS